MVSGAARGACSRAKVAKRSCSSTRSIARSRSGRSGWPSGVKCSRQALWVTSKVDMRSHPGAEAHAGRRLAIVGHEEIECQRLARIDAVTLEIADAFPGQEGVI